ncbi:MAG: hypothetical protein V7K89_30565 [Nostoc sp.]|uniref:hypothetical protein n=1 Tax=Nostoc sp. TaxID=1180 RepID=UPI002FF7F4CB
MTTLRKVKSQKNKKGYKLLNLLMKRDRLENSWAVIQDEAERNWHLLMKDFVDFSFRVQKAAIAAWETFNNSYSP